MHPGIGTPTSGIRWTLNPYPYSLDVVDKIKVATAQGKQGMSIFPDRENTGNLPKDIKNTFLHREFNSNTGKIWRCKKKNNELVI